MNNKLKLAGIIILCIIIAIVVIALTLSFTDGGRKIAAFFVRLYEKLSGGNWFRGIIYTLFVIVGLTNAARGAFLMSPKAEEKFSNLPNWLQTFIAVGSFLCTFGFLVVFFEVII